jgi:hypothetical protein
MTEQVTETFFLPDEIDRETSRLPADIYNTAHSLLSRSETECVFVPVRTLQMFGVVTLDEIVFVDALTYTKQGNEGGRVIQLAWQFNHGHDRDALDQPIEIDVVFYLEQGRAAQQRLVREFRDALALMDRRYRQSSLPADGARIIRLKD